MGIGGGRPSSTVAVAITVITFAAERIEWRKAATASGAASA